MIVCIIFSPEKYTEIQTSKITEHHKKKKRLNLTKESMKMRRSIERRKMKKRTKNFLSFSLLLPSLPL